MTSNYISLDVVCDETIYYTADVISTTDYYPFGSVKPGRNFNSSEYRYGFNGMEKDDEVKGSGNSYDFGARMYDSRVGRWLALDPAAAEYPSLSSYVGMSNNPIFWIDPDGRRVFAGNQAANELLESSITNLFGENSGFTMGPQGYVELDRRQYRQARRGWDSDQKKLAKDFKKVVRSKKFEARVFIGQKEGETFSDKVQAPSVSWTDSEGRHITRTPSPLIIDNQKIHGGTVHIFDDEDYKSFGWVLVNPAELAKIPNDILQDEGITEMGAIETLFHELLDHYLPYMKSGNLNPKTETKEGEVDSYNRAARILKTEERTGDRH